MKAATITRSRNVSPLPRLILQKSRPESLELKKILVPVDFSESSGSALHYAVHLAGPFGAELHLVHVYEPDSAFIDSTALPVIVPARQHRSRLQRQLREFANKHCIPTSNRKLYTIAGAPFEQICRFATNLDVDLIVISTRGNTGLKHLILGSTAERVVRNAPCPVLVLRSNNGQIGRNGRSQNVVSPFRTIVVPIDFSDCSMRGLVYAKKLAKQFGSTLVLLHSIHLQYYVSSDEYARYDFSSVMKASEEVALEQLRDLVRTTRAERFKVESALEIGHAGQQICERSHDRQADLIVTSTHGHTGLKHVFLGSTAEYVVRHAKCPVLVVPTRASVALTTGE